MTSFIVFCAALALAAIFVLAYPLLRPLPATAQGEGSPPRATPLAFVLAALVATGAAFLYSNVSNFPWNDPLLAAQAPAGHGNAGDAAGDCRPGLLSAFEGRAGAAAIRQISSRVRFPARATVTRLTLDGMGLSPKTAS